MTSSTVMVSWWWSWPLRPAGRGPVVSSDLDRVVLTERPDCHVLLTRAHLWVVCSPSGGSGSLRAGVEIRFTTPVWATPAPVDTGTRRVVGDGLRPLHDPRGLLAGLHAAVRGGA